MTVLLRTVSWDWPSSVCLAAPAQALLLGVSDGDKIAQWQRQETTPYNCG